MLFASSWFLRRRACQVTARTRITKPSTCRFPGQPRPIDKACNSCVVIVGKQEGPRPLKLAYYYSKKSEISAWEFGRLCRRTVEGGRGSREAS